jgi:hypothetical protein
MMDADPRPDPLVDAVATLGVIYVLVYTAARAARAGWSA